MNITELKQWIKKEVNDRNDIKGAWEHGYVEALLDVLDKLTE